MLCGCHTNSGRMQQVPRLLDISMHLSDQCLFPGVLHLAAEPSVEIDRDLDVVELKIITIQHVGLDPPFYTIKRWVCTNRNRSRPSR
jgi:hypothetical protein